MTNPLYVFIVICLLLGGIILLTTSLIRRGGKRFVSRQTPALIWISFVSVITGWLAGLLWYAVCDLIIDRDAASSLFADVATHAALSGMMLLVVWLAVLLPIILRNPDVGAEHGAMVNSARGFGVGAAIMGIFCLMLAGIGGPFVLWGLILEAGIIGGVTTLMGSLMRAMRSGHGGQSTNADRYC